MSQYDAWYPPHITESVALSLHEEKYGPAWQLYEYRARPYPSWPLPPIFMHVTMDFMADVYRMVVNWDWDEPAQNSAVTTHDWAWISEDPITSSSYESVEAKFDAFWTATQSFYGTGTRIVGYRWSKWKDDFSKTDPSFRFATRALNAVSTDRIAAPQMACAVTEETDIRRRWGRFYLPFLDTATLFNGRFTNAVCDGIGAAAKDLLETIEDEWQHVTVSTLTPHVLATRFVRVDNVPDVIRSRRWRGSSYRYRSSVT